MVDIISLVLQHPVTLFALGTVVKYFPVVRTVIVNRAIPLVNIAVALLGGLLALLTAATPPDAVPTVAAAVNEFNRGVVTAGFFSFLGGEGRTLLGVVGGALGSAAQAYLLNKLTFDQWGKRPTDSRR